MGTKIVLRSVCVSMTKGRGKKIQTIVDVIREWAIGRKWRLALYPPFNISPNLGWREEIVKWSPIFAWSNFSPQMRSVIEVRSVTFVTSLRFSHDAET